MQGAGIAMLVVAAVAMIVTGLPTWLVLVASASLFAAIGVLSGALPVELLASMPSRIVGLLENDLLQALPLYVLMGVLLDRLPLAELVFRAIARALRFTGAGRPIAGVALGALLAPMNGSVGGSAVMLARTVAPRLEGSVAPERAAAIVAVASTLGVVVPPSLVLILLGDALLRAHTEAVNITGQAVRIVNTQDIFRAALVPAALVLVLVTLVAAWTTHRSRVAREAPIAMSAAETGGALVVVIAILALLGGVTAGYVYAVEAAATGAVALFVYGIASRRLTLGLLTAVLRQTIAVTGALFALLVAATVFTLVVRGFGTDRLLAQWLTGMEGGPFAVLATALAVLAACAFVLDAFEMIFVVVPVLLPPVLVRVPDAVWVATLTLLILQASFLIPPFGYAVQVVRNVLQGRVALRAFARALLPYLGVALCVIALVLAWPGLLWREPVPAAGVEPPPLSDVDAQEQMRKQLGEPE